MKLKIISILKEARVTLDQIVEKYPKMKNLFDQNRLQSLRPEHVLWIAKQNEPPEDVIDLVIEYNKNIQRLKEKELFKYDSNELRFALEELNQNKTRMEIKSDEATNLGTFGPWTVIMPHTTNASILYGKGTKWCTAATQTNNLFLSYVGRKDEDIILYYIINENGKDKLSIGFINGKPEFSSHNGGITVDQNNIGLTEQKTKQILQDQYVAIMKTLLQHSELIKEKHPAKKEIEEMIIDESKFDKYIEKYGKNEEQLEEFFYYTLYAYMDDIIPKILVKIIFTYNCSIFVRSKNFDQHMLILLYEDIIKSKSIDKKHYNKELLGNILRNENCPKDILKQYYRSSDENYRCNVARNPNTDADILELMLKKNQNNEPVLVCIIRNPNFTNDMFYYIFNTYKSNAYLLGTLLEKPNCPSEIFYACYKMNIKYLKKIMSKNINAPKEIYDKLEAYRNINL